MHYANISNNNMQHCHLTSLHTFHFACTHTKKGFYLGSQEMESGKTVTDISSNLHVIHCRRFLWKFTFMHLEALIQNLLLCIQGTHLLFFPLSLLFEESLIKSEMSSNTDNSLSHGFCIT